MNTLKDYVNWNLTHADKVAEAEGYPLVMENCKKNKRMKQLEVYGSSLQDGTPTPDNPIEVQSVGEKSVNLFDVNVYPLTIGKVIYGHSGESGDVSGYAATVTYITCTDLQGKIITINHTKGVNVGIAFYDESKVYMSGVRYQNATSITVTVPENAIYYRFSVDVNYINEIQVQEGNVVTPYEPYGKYKIPVVSRGINFFSMAKSGLTEKSTNGITFIPLDDERIYIKGKISDNSLDAKYTATFKTKIPIKAGVYNVKPNQYTGYQKDLSIIYGVYKNNNAFLVNINSMNNMTTVNVTQDGYIGIVTITVSKNSTREWDDIIELQITKGAENRTLPYEPYVEPTTTNIFLDAPLCKIGDYADFVDFKGKKVIRNTIARVYNSITDKNNPFNKSDGEENWAGKSTNSDKNENFWEYSLNDPLPIIPKYGHATANDYKQVPICLQLPVKVGIYNSETSPPTVDKELIWFCQQARSVRLFLSKDRVDGNLTSFQSFLKNNPITVLCATYQPYEEPLNVDLPKLNAKTTIIEVDTSLAPSDAYAKYIKK